MSQKPTVEGDKVALNRVVFPVDVDKIIELYKVASTSFAVKRTLGGFSRVLAQDLRTTFSRRGGGKAPTHLFVPEDAMVEGISNGFDDPPDIRAIDTKGLWGMKVLALPECIQTLDMFIGGNHGGTKVVLCTDGVSAVLGAY